jgi:hypothetical protein
LSEEVLLMAVVLVFLNLRAREEEEEGCVEYRFRLCTNGLRKQFSKALPVVVPSNEGKDTFVFLIARHRAAKHRVPKGEE